MTSHYALLTDKSALALDCPSLNTAHESFTRCEYTDASSLKLSVPEVSVYFDDLFLLLGQKWHEY